MVKYLVLASVEPFDKMVSHNASRSSTSASSRSSTSASPMRAVLRNTRSARRRSLALKQIGTVLRLLQRTYCRGSRAANRNLNGRVASCLLQCNVFLSVLLNLLQVALGGGRPNSQAGELFSNPALHADVFCLFFNSHVKIEKFIAAQCLLDERSAE